MTCRSPIMHRSTAISPCHCAEAVVKAVATPVVCDVCGRVSLAQAWACPRVFSSDNDADIACRALGYERMKAQAADALKRLDEMEAAETLARRAYCRMWSPRHPMTVPEMMADAVAMFETAAHPELANLAQQRYADRTAQWEAEVRRRVDAEDRAEALAGERDALRGLLAGWLTPRLHDRHAPDAGYGDRCKTGCPGCSKTAEIYIRTNCALAKPPAGQAPPPAQPSAPGK